MLWTGLSLRLSLYFGALIFSSTLKNSPTAWGCYQHTLLLAWYSAGEEQSWFPSNMMLWGSSDQIILFLTAWGTFRCFFHKFQVCFHASTLNRGLSLAIKPRSMECCCGVCPSVGFSHLHIQYMIIEVEDDQVLGQSPSPSIAQFGQEVSSRKRPGCFKLLPLRVTETKSFCENSMKQNFFSELFPRCVAWCKPLYRQFFWPQDLVFAWICIISCWTFY